MAFADGIQGVMDARKDFVAFSDDVVKGAKKMVVAVQGFSKASKIALAATGIGLIVVALAAIVTYWDEITVAMQGANSEQAKSKKLYEDTKKELNNQLQTHKNTHDTQILQGKTEKELLETEIKITEQLIAQDKHRLSMQEAELKRAVAEREKLGQKTKGLIYLYGMWKTPEEVKKAGELGFVEQKKNIETSEENLAKSKLAIQAIDKTANDKAITDAKKDTDKAIENAKVAAEKEKQRLAIDFQSKLDLIKDANEKELVEFDAKREAERKAAELVNADLIKFDSATLLLRGNIERNQIEENNKKKLEQEKKFQDDLKKIKDDELALTEELTKQYFDKQRLEITNNHIKNKTSDEAFAKELEDVKIRELNAKLVAQKDYGIDTTATELEIANATNEINTKSNTKSLEEQKKYEESLQSLKTQAITAGFELLRALNQEGDNATEAAQKKAFERNKAMAIAETVITTYQAAALAYKNGLQTGDVTQTTSILGAAVAVAQGLAKLVIIKKQTFKGTGSTNTSGGGGGGTGGGGIQAPTTGFTQIRQPQNPNQPQQKQPPVKVFVVQKDIQEATIAADRITAKAVVK
jgi:hypothetical protein